MPCSKVIFAVLFIGIFPAYSNIGVIFSAKLGQNTQFLARNGTNWHAKLEKSPFFVRKTPILATFSLYSLFRPYIPQSRRVIGGNDVWVTSQLFEKKALYFDSGMGSIHLGQKYCPD